ncbi:MAG: hypothetical protein HY726_21835 [Candidatus Rokubacteria bacterium]|nr:hypothetical protein [Candidatus Rokubacteria bacterium]
MGALRRRLARRGRLWLPAGVLVFSLLIFASGDREPTPFSSGPLLPPAHAGIKVFRKNTCENSGCHRGLKIVEQIHPFGAVRCAECHGGDDTQADKERAHVPRPANFGEFPLTTGTHTTDAAPKEKRGPRMYRQDDPTNSDHRDPALLAYRRFRNPGDLLVAQQSCGPSGCHGEIVERVTRSLHATVAGLMSGIYFANGHPGASEGRVTDFVGNATDKRDGDKVAKLAILLPRGEPIVDPNFDPSIPGTIPAITKEVPRNDQEIRAGKKSNSLGMATFYIQTDCGRCHLYTSGSKAPGDYRPTGCTACHVVYKSEGFSESFDQTIPKNETDHPVKHKIVRFTPIEQCAHCHNRGARHTQRFLGFRERPQGDNALPQFRILNEHNENNRVDDFTIGGRKGGFYPSAPRYFKPGDLLFGRSYDPSRLGSDIVKGFPTQSIWRRDIRVSTQQAPRNPFFIVDENTANDFDETPPDIHAERGMACVDCHTKREMHGDGHIYTDRFHKTEIQCESCHGSAFEVSNLKTRFGNPVRGLFRDGEGRVFLRLNTTGEVRPVVQIKEVIDSGRNPNAQGPSHVLHGRLECYTCHAKWHDQCNSCHMITDYTSSDSGGFFQRSYMDNEVRNATQGQPRFVTTFDQLILGINAKGRIQNYHTGGQATLFANKVAGGGGAEANLSEGNFLEFSRCSGGSNDRGLCENDSDCPGGSCPALSCAGGPRSGRSAEAEGQCKQCTAGTRVGQSCSLDVDCGTGGKCEGGTLSRVCFGGANDGQACLFDPKNPTDNPDCPSGSCGVRMFNFAFTTIENGRHLPSLMMNPLFPHTVRKIPRNCDSCHPTPGFQDTLNIEQVAKAIGLGTGKSRVLDPSAPNGFRDIRISRRVRIFTNGKGDLSIAPEDLSSSNPATGLSLKNGDEVLVDTDRFVNLELEVQGGQIKVRKLTQVKPTTHVGTSSLDISAIEKILNNPQVPQIPSQPGP